MGPGHPPVARARRIGIAIAVVALLLVVAVVALGPLGLAWRDLDRHVVRLAWDADGRRLLVNEPIRESLAQDGPFVRRRADGDFELMRVVERAHGGDRWQPETQVLPGQPSPQIEVRVDNRARTRFHVPLRAPAMPPPASVPMPPRLLLVSDLEGQFDAFVALLQAQGVIDAELHWRYGAGQLVLAGDLVDRGDHVLPLLWLVYRLEDEAARAGGRVHYLLGNHELLALQGRFRHAPPRLFASRDAFFGGDNRRVFAADTVLGQWLRTKPVIVRVGEVLVVHGGISRGFLAQEFDIAAANALARRELDLPAYRRSDAAQSVIGEAGPPWYRGMARPDKASEADPDAHLQAVLAGYGVRHLAIGHTRLPHAGSERAGRLLRLDVDHARRPEALLLEGGRVYRVNAAGDRARLQ